MRFSVPKNTLAYNLEARPLTNKINFGQLPVAHFSERASKYLAFNSMEMPERAALWFYSGAHALSAIRARNGVYARLPQAEEVIVEQHFARANDIFLRLFYYTLVICVRETRHLYHKEMVKGYLVEAGVLSAYKLIKSVPDSAHEAMKSIISGAPAGLTVYELCKAMSIAFHKGSWASGYGGKKWGVIADALVDVVTGTISPEMFCDVGFALAHNGGPIFNKGMFYHSYGGHFIEILDCQRGGQIPRYIASNMPGVLGDMQEFVSACSFLGPDFVGPVDWAAVQAAGPKKSYTDKLSQEQKAADLKKKADLEAAKAKAAAEKAAEEEKGTVGYVQYWPGLKMKILTREAAEKAVGAK